MNRPELLALLENFSVTVAAPTPTENLQTLTMVGAILNNVQTTKLGGEYKTVVDNKIQSLSENGGQNL